jgi:hypothetical protein
VSTAKTTVRSALASLSRDGALRRRRQSQQERRIEVVDEAPVGGRLGVVKLVDDDVVKRVGLEAVEVRLAAEGLHRREQDLLAMGDEQDTAELLAVGVEGGEP